MSTRIKDYSSRKNLNSPVTFTYRSQVNVEVLDEIVEIIEDEEEDKGIVEIIEEVQDEDMIIEEQVPDEDIIFEDNIEEDKWGPPVDSNVNSNKYDPSASAGAVTHLSALLSSALKRSKPPSTALLSSALLRSQPPSKQTPLGICAKLDGTNLATQKGTKKLRQMLCASDVLHTTIVPKPVVAQTSSFMDPDEDDDDCIITAVIPAKRRRADELVEVKDLLKNRDILVQRGKSPSAIKQDDAKLNIKMSLEIQIGNGAVQRLQLGP